MLTAKQEKFVNNLFQGMSQREAWVEAGYSSKYSVADIDSHACRLANQDKVKTRLEEMRQATKSELIATEIERQEKLSELYRIPVERKPTPKEVVMAIAEHNKMTKVYVDAPTVDHRSITILVSNEEAKRLSEGIGKFGLWNGRDKRD